MHEDVLTIINKTFKKFLCIDLLFISETKALSDSVGTLLSSLLHKYKRFHKHTVYIDLKIMPLTV